MSNQNSKDKTKFRNAMSKYAGMMQYIPFFSEQPKSGEQSSTEKCDALLSVLFEGSVFDSRSTGNRKALDSRNFRLSKKVLERLLLRHSILRDMEKLEANYLASKTFIPKGGLNTQTAGSVTPGDKSFGTRTTSVTQVVFNVQSEKDLRAYRLAVTDVFVEKAIAYLEHDYERYMRWGALLFLIGIAIVGGGAWWAAHLTWSDAVNPCKDLPFLKKDQCATLVWYTFGSSFVKSFTLFGFIVIVAVYCFRLGKTLMDQAERTRERRHSLRQGRLIIHLNNGDAPIEEILKAFDWNVSKGNAFSNLPTETSAPWGGVIKDAIKAVGEAFKSKPFH